MGKDNLTIKFLNHAGFMLESEQSLLIIDPWLEGSAFFNGWSLIDKSTSNEELATYINNSQKKIFIWYSHEHPDHLSFPFLRLLNQKNLQILYQKTIDRRIISALKVKNFNVKEQKDGIKKVIDQSISITTWKWIEGDSFCVIEANDNIILNLNDCVLRHENDFKIFLKKIRQFKDKVDLLFTQFGYANWIGNEKDAELRRNASEEKLIRLKIQNKFLKPKFIIPFASFIHFCHEENFYMNDLQNTPSKVLNSKKVDNFREKIFFLKPNDKVNLISENILYSDLKNNSISAYNHWNKLFKKEFDIYRIKDGYDLNQIKKLFKDYVKKVNRKFFYINLVLEYLKSIKPLIILLRDNNKIIQLSYIKGIKEVKNGDWHICLSTESLSFILKNEYGFNTIHVNARFRTNPNFTLKNQLIFYKFFSIQELIKNGFDTSNLRIFFIKILELTIIKFFKKY